MSKWTTWRQRNPQLIAYLLIVLAMGVGFYYMTQQDNDIEEAAQERKEQICYAVLEDRILLKDILDFVAGDEEAAQQPIDPTLPEQVRKLIEDSRKRSVAFKKFADERIELPPVICLQTGVTIKDVLKEQERLGQRPEQQ